MKRKNPNKSHKRIDKSFTNALTQTKTHNYHINCYNTAAVIHNRFSRLVSSKTVYTLQYTPKTKHTNK